MINSHLVFSFMGGQGQLTLNPPSFFLKFFACSPVFNAFFSGLFQTSCAPVFQFQFTDGKSHGKVIAFGRLLLSFVVVFFCFFASSCLLLWPLRFPYLYRGVLTWVPSFS